MKTETDSQSVNESLDALDNLLQKVIQPIVGQEFSEKINDNEGFQDGKEALKNIRMIRTVIEEMKNRINDLPDEDVLETKFCEHSVPNGLAECADDIHWDPEQDKEKENDNAFSVPIMKIRDNLLRKMSQEIVESAKADSDETKKIIREQQEELKTKLDDQENNAENIKKELLTELENKTKEPFQMIQQQIQRQMRLVWCTLCLSGVGTAGAISLIIFYLLRK